MFRRLSSLIIILVLLTGCAPVEDFNPYYHMKDIILCSKEQEYMDIRDYILEHTDESLHEQMDVDMKGDIVDQNYSIKEAHTWIEQNPTQVYLVGEYQVITTYNRYYLLAYYTYENNKLVSYDYDRIYVSDFPLSI